MTTLPPDILREIFKQCLSEDIYPVPSTAVAPLLLTEVCKTWRDITLNTPSLWTKAEFYEPSELLPLEKCLKGMETLLEFIILWMTRSGRMPLSISLTNFEAWDCLHSPEGEMKLEQANKRLLDIVLLRNGGRIRNLAISTFAQQRWKSFFSLAAGHMEMLECLYVGNSRDFDPSTTVFKDAPNLRRLILDMPCDTAANFGFPWSRLTHVFVLDESSLSFSLDLLRDCPDLMEVSIYLPSQMPRRFLPSPIACPKLTSLSIVSRFFVPEFLGQVHLPSLRDLTLCAGVDITNPFRPGRIRINPAAHNTLSFYKEIGNIHSLTLLGNFDLTPEILSAFLSSAPLLESLTISFLPDFNYPPFVKALGWTDEQNHTNLVPFLRKCTFVVNVGTVRTRAWGFDPANVFDFTRFLEIVRSRSTKGGFLEQVDLYIEDEDADSEDGDVGPEDAYFNVQDIVASAALQVVDGVDLRVIRFGSGVVPVEARFREFTCNFTPGTYPDDWDKVEL